MKRFTLAVLVSIGCLSHATAEDQSIKSLMQGNREKTIQILLEKDSRGKDSAMLIDTKGQKIDLTLGTLLNASAEAFIDTDSAAVSEVLVDPNAIVFIKLEREAKGAIEARLFSKDGRNERLNFGNLLAEAALMYPGCTGDKINGQNVKIVIHFEIDDNGKIQAYLNSRKGKEEFNLGIMFREVILMLNQCQLLF